MRRVGTGAQLITSARMSHTQDLALRQRRYLITQGVRLLCILLACLLPVDPVWKIGFIAAGMLLPMFGVISANAGPALVPAGRATPLMFQERSPEKLRALEGTVLAARDQEP